MTDYLWIIVSLVYLMVFVYMTKKKIHNPAYTLAGTLLLSITSRVRNEMCMIISTAIVLIALITNVIIILKKRYNIKK